MHGGFTTAVCCITCTLCRTSQLAHDESTATNSVLTAATLSQPTVEAATVSLLPELGAHSAVLRAQMTGACAICEDISSISSSSNVSSGSTGDDNTATATASASAVSSSIVEDDCSDDDSATAEAIVTASAAASSSEKRAKELLRALLTDAADDPATE
jgi:hypothetical protein